MRHEEMPRSPELVCPRDKSTLHSDRRWLVCDIGHEYPVVDGIPVMLLAGDGQTHDAAVRSLDEAYRSSGEGDWGKGGEPGGVDSFVQYEIAATNGQMYRSLVGRLREYPIPTLRLPRGNNDDEQKHLLDLGCNWGRWCMAAYRLGYQPIGLDPSLDAVRAARRVASQLGVSGRFFVGDARHLPFRNSVFDVVFSYSVLQHFEKDDALMALWETSRVLKVGGTAKVQMANAFGVRSVYHQARRRFRGAKGFEVRYWKPGELKSVFEMVVGPTVLAADGYLTLNPQPSEAHLLPSVFQKVVRLSEVLRRASETVRPLLYLADSLYVTAQKSRGVAEVGRAVKQS